MKSVIKIDILSEKRQFTLAGDTHSLLQNRRAMLYLNEYLKVDLSSSDNVLIGYEEGSQEQVLQELLKFLSKHGFESELSENIRSLMSDFIQEEENFKEFSSQAFSIRNNNLSEQHHKDFENFTNILIGKLKRSLYPLQLLSAYHLTFSQNACNFSVPGSGKTSIVYGAYAFLRNLSMDDVKRVDKLLVIGPLSSFGPWEAEYKECFGMPAVSKRLSGGLSKEEKAYHFYASNPAELTLVSYQGVPNMFQDIVNFLKKYKVMVVLDEAHKIKNIEGGIIAGVILRLAQYCKSRVILTGTPAPNGYEDLYNLFKFIWPNKNVIKYHPFQLKDMTQNNNDRRIPELVNQVSPYFLRIKKTDLGLPNPIDKEPIVVKMGSLQSEIYNYIENKYMDFFKAHMGSSNLSSMFSKARLIRLMQASTNPALLKKPIDVYFQELGIGNETFIDDSGIIDKILKYETLEVPQKFLTTGALVKSLIEKNLKVIVWSIFIQNIHDFSAYLSSIGIESRQLYGATPIEGDNDDMDNNVDNETREGIIREFHNPSSVFKVIIANPFAISESISLHKACHNAIYLERSFNAANFIQSKDRIHRYGLKKDDQINYFYILSDNNIDFTIHQRLKEKEKRMMDIIEKEPIPLFKLLEETDEIDIRALIDNYVKRTKRL